MKKTYTHEILIVMRILAWLGFVGFMIEAGGVLTSYVVSCFNPAAAKNLYMQLNLYALQQASFVRYTLTVGFILALAGLRALLFYLAVRTLSKVNMANPFTIDVARIIEKISYVLLGIWVISLLKNPHISWLGGTIGNVPANTIGGDEYLFMAGLIFIISMVFKRGIELQSENDLTI